MNDRRPGTYTSYINAAPVMDIEGGTYATSILDSLMKDYNISVDPAMPTGTVVSSYTDGNYGWIDSIGDLKYYAKVFPRYIDPLEGFDNPRFRKITGQEFRHPDPKFCDGRECGPVGEECPTCNKLVI